MAVVSHNRAMGRGWDACSTQAGRARTPPATISPRVGNRAPPPPRPTSETPNTTATGHHFVGLEGGAARGELLGFSARAKGAGSAPRKGEWRVDRYHPESRKGRRKSSPLYAADDELIHPP